MFVGRLPALTGMRGLAALYVAVYHAWQLYVAKHPVSAGVDGVYRYGWIGVDLFFVLSAFLLATPLLRKNEVQSFGYWANYLRRRWIRIAPPYYASILFAMFAAGTMNYLWTRPTTLMLHGAYAQTFVDGLVWTINPVYWSLAVEFQFYVVLPVLLWFLLRTHPIVGLVAAYTVSMTWNVLTIDMHSPSADNFWALSQLPGYLFHFALGITAARLYVGNHTIAKSARPWLWACVPILVVAPLLLAAPPPSLWSGMAPLPGTFIVRAGPAIGFALAIFLAANPERIVSRALGNRFTDALGERSYSLYLMHFPVMTFIASKMPWTLDHGFVMFQLILAAPVMLATWILYVLVETPSLNWKDRSSKPTPGPTPTTMGPKPTASTAMLVAAVTPKQ